MSSRIILVLRHFYSATIDALSLNIFPVSSTADFSCSFHVSHITETGEKPSGQGFTMSIYTPQDPLDAQKKKMSYFWKLLLGTLLPRDGQSAERMV